MGGEVEARSIVVARGGEHQDAIFVPELAQIVTLSVVVDAQHVGVEPHLAAAQRRVAFLFEGNRLDVVLGQHVAACGTRLDSQFGQVLEYLQFLQMKRRLQGDADHLSLAVGIGGEIDYARTGFALRQVVLLVAGHARHVEALHIVYTASSVAIDDVIDGTFVLLLEDIDMQDIRADKELLGHTNHLVLTVFVEDDDVVQVGAVAEELVFLESRSDEAFLAVDIQLLVVLHHGGYVDRAEVAHLGAARITGTVFLLEVTEPGDGVVGEVVEILLALLDLFCQFLHQFVRLLGVELGDADHADLKESLDILGTHLADELGFPGLQSLVHKLNQVLLVGRILIAGLLVDTVLDEDLLQRSIEVFLLQFGFLDLQFPLEQCLGVVHRLTEQVAHRGEDRLLIFHYAAVGRDIHLAIREGIQRIDSFVAGRSRRQLHDDACLLGRKVVYLANLDLALLIGTQDGLDNFAGGGTVRDFGDDECAVVVSLLDLSTDLDLSATFAVVVSRYVYLAARGEVGIEGKLFLTQISQGGIAYLVEVMRQYLGVQSDGNTLYALCEQQGEFDRQVDRFFLTTVVRQHPLRSLGVEYRLQGELRQPSLDITGSSGTIAGQDIAPVTLAIDQQVFLSQLHQRIADRGIAVGVILHGLTDNVGHLVHLAVVHALHGVQYTTLNGLESVFDSGHSSFQNDIRSIVQEPVLVHAGQVIFDVIRMVAHQSTKRLIRIKVRIPTNSSTREPSSNMLEG